MKLKSKRINIFIILFFALSAIVSFLTVLVIQFQPKKITFEQFEKEILDKDNDIIYYGQDSCGACQSVYPEIKMKSREYKVKFSYLDADSIDGSRMEQYGIRYTPSIIVLKNGSMSIYDDVNNSDVDNIFKSIKYDSIIYDRPKNLTEISYEELQGKIGLNTDFILYIGRTDCKDCQKFHPIASDYKDNNENNGIYFFNIKKIRDKSLVDDALEIDINFYNKIKNDFDINWVPSVYHIKNGEIISKFEYLSSEYYELNDLEKESAEINYNNEFYQWMEKCNQLTEP